ncbi:undecaprenyl/decaprenyl-phosphate alpha-N-acetylglucosaminyl 1-phosphate transferase [Treponema primitia]|uniref:MraY family glycosyltransferase n=1 Tax=Treponema primitia TaxID=88058 RepID=UPI0039811ADC
MVFVFSIVIVTSFVISVIIVAQVLVLSHKKSWYDPIDERKIHTGDVPRLGGIGFAAAFIFIYIGIGFVLPLFPVQIIPGVVFHLPFLFPLISMILVFVSGVFDDFKPMAPRFKLLIQFIAAFLVVVSGYSFRSVLFFDRGILGNLGWLRYPITFLWIVGLTNAVNLIDGVDGLAGGISALAALFFALIFSLVANSSAIILICLCLSASLVGFLVFNMPFPRAKIFMGDGGSQFLGFILALLPLMNVGNTSPGFPLLYAAAMLTIPIFDTFAAIWRRVRDRRRIDTPDQLHIHHKLMNLGFNVRGVDAILYGLQIILGVLVFESIRYKGALSLIFLGAAYMASSAFFVTIHFVNRYMVRKRKNLAT